MKRYTIMKILFLLLCVLASSSPVQAQVYAVWELVTDYTTLSTSDTYVIAGNHTPNGTVWRSLKNNLLTTADYLPVGSVLTITNNRITSTVSDNETWVLESTGTTGVYYIKSTKGSNYLQNNNSTKSLINSKPGSSNDANRQWRIHYSDSGEKDGIVYTVTGLYNVGNNRMLTVYDGSPISWHAETRSYYNYIQDQEVVLFRKVTTANASISSAEYATFSSPYALNFSGEEGLKVFTAGVNDANTKVILREVTNKRVPANTAVVLHGAKGTYTGTIIAEADALTDNELHVATEEMSGAGQHIYVLNKVDGVVGFYLLSDEGTLEQGKAYLTLNSGAPMLSLSEDGEATAVRDLPLQATTGSGVCYTLDGRRVTHPAKGVFIQNGKKIVIR
jgi:hypothetical protein